ncbi:MULTISPECIES: TetR/AcrR family transcriptional regulator [Actinoalloteichus]|uniref:Transcriptional regulator, TetR family n=1 Tax=Actinoalloteichus fjordicus TaxID=1612552 RepID=A0AAC9PT55_9PSEU|nr:MULTISPECIES: TetR/AcrR family transcriptional regulator [Actinoalloteichus]APU15516.1 transcriptional regulator, TetR family [Actinoalloteichus fjordicus]APU21583.1 transcriptional regulator, TetR family [Actinoalloteichus sp. GBA129-24]
MPVRGEGAGAADVDVPAAATRAGRPPLSERRKTEMRLGIAREAVRLFAERGVDATSAEDIALAAGISLRTFWRYAATKEGCVRPLLTTGVDVVTRALSRWHPGADPAVLVDEAAAAAGQAITDVPTVLALIRLTRTEPGLRAVWLTVHDDAELIFATALGRSTGFRPDGLRARVRAAMVNGALRAAVEHHAWGSDDAEETSAGDREGRIEGAGLVEAVREALRVAVHGLYP